MKKIIMMLLLAAFATAAHAAPDWELKKDKDGIKVYTGAVAGSNIKAVKVTCTIAATTGQLTALLLDMKAHEQWVYNTKTSYLVKELGPARLVYYSEVSMPWPLANRDVVAEMSITQQPDTKVLYINAATVAGYVAEKDGKVRVASSKVSWVVTPIGDNQLQIVYEASADPGGDVPAWAVNSFCTKGPYETFKKLKEIVATYPRGQYVKADKQVH